ncbi:hypothetical protein VA596_01935 [Amycolatopsis sp., V23-08]|uniref:Uncharacterized protein n=1 Tax=Amycolatopsis heterodermiae TaxID=3110235 RepID=A0ABU5QWI3_9PSEU|nr:hypothetical protein [Amycolatopsis sp., V23-08]MEA5358282.1 hypothetical protein [Amycolatopsis sp., V23-08]
MWQFALWGLVGAVANRGVVFLEALQRAKGWPWPRPYGPGGGPYAASIIVHVGVAAAASSVAAAAGLITNVLLAFGVGAAAPSVVKKLASYAERMVKENAAEGGLEVTRVDPQSSSDDQQVKE